MLIGVWPRVPVGVAIAWFSSSTWKLLASSYLWSRLLFILRLSSGGGLSRGGGREFGLGILTRGGGGVIISVSGSRMNIESFHLSFTARGNTR